MTYPYLVNIIELAQAATLIAGLLIGTGVTTYLINRIMEGKR
jgi:hypothetical protein